LEEAATSTSGGGWVYIPTSPKLVVGLLSDLHRTVRWPLPDSLLAQHPSPAPHLITSKYYGPFGVRDFSPNPAFFL